MPNEKPGNDGRPQPSFGFEPAGNGKRHGQWQRNDAHCGASPGVFHELGGAVLFDVSRPTGVVQRAQRQAKLMTWGLLGMMFRRKQQIEIEPWCAPIDNQGKRRVLASLLSATSGLGCGYHADLPH